MEADINWISDLLYVACHVFAVFAGMRHGGAR